MILCALFAQLQSQDIRRTMAAGPKEAIVMSLPDVAAAASVRDMVWTADGSYLVVERSLEPATVAPPLGAPVPPQTELVAWSRKTRKSKVLMSFDPDRTRIDAIQPMGGSDRILIQARVLGATADQPPTRVATLLSPATGSAVRIGALSEDPPQSAMVSPQRSFGVIVQRNRGLDTTIRSFGQDGRLGGAVSLGRVSWIDFDSKGYLSEIRFPDKGQGRRQRRRIDLTTGKPGTWEDDSPGPAVNAVGDLEVTEVRVVAGTTIPIPLVRLAMSGGTAEEAGIVSSDGTKPSLSPKGDAVAYIDQGVAMVRTFTRVPRKSFEDALLAEERAKVLSRAKQVGLALMIYANDSDDTYPGAGDVTDLLMPYAKDRSIFDGFTYTYGGGKITDIAEPASTEIGFVTGPGGRAVIYADGHVKWRPDV